MQPCMNIENMKKTSAISYFTYIGIQTLSQFTVTLCDVMCDCTTDNHHAIQALIV